MKIDWNEDDRDFCKDEAATSDWIGKENVGVDVDVDVERTNDALALKKMRRKRCGVARRLRSTENRTLIQVLRKRFSYFFDG